MASLIPAYNLNSAKRGLIDRIDVNSTDGNLRSFTYTGFEFGAAARIQTGDAVRRLDDRPHDPRITATSSRTGATCRRCIYDASGNNSQQPKSDYHFCNQSELGLPFLHEFKLSGSYQLPWEIQVNAAFQSYSGPHAADAVEHRPDDAVRRRTASGRARRARSSSRT